jgi:hypothetical protein
MRKIMPLQTRQPLGTKQPFPPRRDYASLSIKDLVDARDAYQTYLSTLENVFATAIGRYLIHEKDWYATHPSDELRPQNYPRVTEPRTFMNSVLRPWSWPAVIVLVKQWESAARIGNEIVPRSLYLPDGRVVPTCVVQATPDETLPRPTFGPFHNSDLLGGGYACMRKHQGEESFGTFSCLARKGGTYYVLTNRHVAGGDGEAVNAFIRGRYEPVGQTCDIAADRIAMSAAFPQWGNARLFLTLDAGLVRINDISDWTSQAFGIGEIAELYDATEQSITLDLIGCPVRAFGGTTGVSEGEIRALFYRYQSVGGSEYATDVLIAARKGDRRITNENPLTSPGDSGALWFYDPPKEGSKTEHEDFDNRVLQVEQGLRARRLRPIAMQWGGQRLVDKSGVRSAFALGSFLSTICRTLDIELVRNWSIGHDEYWGKIGHFAIGWKACDELTGSLGVLMKKNQARIGFGNKILRQGSAFRMGRGGFVPLADVPDYVWVVARGIRPYEGNQHFADIDIYDIDGGDTLLKRCIADSKNISASVWKAYFDGFKGRGVGPDEGCLPLRVWQIWDAMNAYLQMKDVLHFVAAAGIMAHYVGDASQPLHCSWLHHGVPPTKKVDGRQYPHRHDSHEYADFKKTRQAKIHGIYEETMLEIDPATALAEVDQWLHQAGRKKLTIDSGHDAAVATIHLMFDAQRRLSPRTIIKNDKSELGPKARAKILWEKDVIRENTITSLAQSVNLLAALWSAAWESGGGNRLPKSKLVEFAEEDLEHVYRQERNFLPSLSLAAMVKTRRFEA